MILDKVEVYHGITILTPKERHSFFVEAAVHPRVAAANIPIPIAMQQYEAYLCISNRFSSAL